MVGQFFISLLKSVQGKLREAHVGWLHLPLWGAALCTIFCNHEGPCSELKPNSVASRKKDQKTKVCIIFIPVLVTTALRKSGRKEVKKVGCCALSLTSSTLWSSSSCWKGHLKCAMRGKQSSGCIRDMKGSINHISGDLFASPVQTLYANIRHISVLQIKCVTHQCHDCASKGDEATLPSSCPELCLFYEPVLAAHSFHLCKTYLLHTSAKLIARPYQLHSLQFCFSWPQTHLL